MEIRKADFIPVFIFHVSFSQMDPDWFKPPPPPPPSLERVCKQTVSDFPEWRPQSVCVAGGETLLWQLVPHQLYRPLFKARGCRWTVCLGVPPACCLLSAFLPSHSTVLFAYLPRPTHAITCLLKAKCTRWVHARSGLSELVAEGNVIVSLVKRSAPTGSLSNQSFAGLLPNSP